MTSDEEFFALLDQVNNPTSEDGTTNDQSSQEESQRSRAATIGDVLTGSLNSAKQPSKMGVETRPGPSAANLYSTMSNSEHLKLTSPRVGVSQDLHDHTQHSPMLTTPTVHQALQGVIVPSPCPSKTSSQATTVSCDPSPEKVRSPSKFRSLSSGYEDMMRRERELEELRSPGVDYVSVFEELVRDSIPQLGPVERNEITSRFTITDSPARGTDNKGKNPGSRANKISSTFEGSRIKRQRKDIETSHPGQEQTFKPPVMKRTATEPILEAPHRRTQPPRNVNAVQKQPPRKTAKGGLNMKPETQQFLRGQVFYWVPNDEKLLGRKIRMDRAREWGAERAIALTSEVTYLIIEENWDYQYALRQLGLRGIPKHIWVVNDKYLPACIELRQMADPSSARFRVKGHQEILDREKEEEERTNALPTVEREAAKSTLERQITTPGRHAVSSSFQSPEHPESSSFDRVSIRTDDYEVPDSQLDALPGSPPELFRTPTRTGRTGSILQSLKVKHDRRNLLTSSPETPEDIHRRKVFVSENQVPPKPFAPDANPSAGRKRIRTSQPRDSTPYVTPALVTPARTISTAGSQQLKDELDLAVEETRAGAATSPSPEVNSRPSSSHAFNDDGGLSDDARFASPSTPAAEKRNKAFSPRSWQETFACMHAHDGSATSGNPNAATIAILEKMAEHYELVRDNWRLMAYRKAIGKLKLQKDFISTAAQARKLHGIGDRIADKIEEIVTRGSLRQLDAIEQDTSSQDEAVKLFTQVYGAGISQARKWIADGHRTLDDLKTKATLTKNQQIGIERFEDFRARIPRSEITAHVELVNKICAEISWRLKLVVGGSYRRGAENSGDIDFLITSREEELPDHALHGMIFEQLIPRLFEIGYLTVALASSSSTSRTIWHGAAVLPAQTAQHASPSSEPPGMPSSTARAAENPSSSSRPVWRRVDILMVPPNEWGAALLYFTGNDIFNRSMRLLARKKGYRLNQQGLYENVMRDRNNQKVTEGTLVESKDEKRIFEILGVPYRPPEHRVC